MTNQSAARELEACPFCGFAGDNYTGLRHVQTLAAALDLGDGIHRYRCSKCGAETGPHATENGAREAWNTRALHPSRERTLFDAIKHGDEDHQAWLKDAITYERRIDALGGTEPGQSEDWNDGYGAALELATEIGADADAMIAELIETLDALLNPSAYSTLRQNAEDAELLLKRIDARLA